MMGGSEAVIHINVTDFAASVEMLKNPSLADKPFILAKEGGGRKVVIIASRKAQAEGVYPGLSVDMAHRLCHSLVVVPPDPPAYAKADAAMTEIVQQYSPAIQCDKGGHLYLDMKGMGRLFGPPVDCAMRIRNELYDRLQLTPAVAVASNKLVAKIGTRTIRPCGIAQIRGGEEASFLSHQDIALLPGVGPSISRLLCVAGIREIGQIAELGDVQVLAFLGKRGLALRDAARGLDSSVVDTKVLEQRKLVRRVDFNEPVFEFDAFRSAVISAAEDAGMELRSQKMGCSTVHMTITYSDGSTAEGSKRTKGQWVLDNQLMEAAWAAALQALLRRVRILSFSLALGALAQASLQPDLFVPEAEERTQRLQAAVDATRSRFGVGILTHAAAVYHG